LVPIYEMSVIKDLKDANNNLQEESLKAFSDYKKFFGSQYPKLILLIIIIIITYHLFQNPLIVEYTEKLNQIGYVGIFIAGMLFAFGFSAPIAVAFFIISNPSNIIIAGIVAGFGAFLSDMAIFNWVKYSLEDEFEKIKHSKTIKGLNKKIERNIGLKIRNYLLYFFAGILIASPLPDEVGVTMMAGLTKIKRRVLGIISFILNTIGITIILYLT